MLSGSHRLNSLKAGRGKKGPLLPMAKSEVNTAHHHHQNQTAKSPFPKEKKTLTTALFN